jgi:hypothetical protein
LRRTAERAAARRASAWFVSKRRASYVGAWG